MSDRSGNRKREPVLNIHVSVPVALLSMAERLRPPGYARWRSSVVRLSLRLAAAVGCRDRVKRLAESLESLPPGESFGVIDSIVKELQSKRKGENMEGKK